MNPFHQFSRHFALLLPALLLIGVAPLGAVEVHVATNGDGSNPGTSAKPFATLEGARDAVRSLIKKGLDVNVTIRIHSGRYELERTLVVGLDDSTPTGRTITYAAVEGEGPVFTSCKVIDG